MGKEEKGHGLSEEQKIQIAHEAATSGLTNQELADEYGITINTLISWKKKYMPEIARMSEIQEKSIEELDRDYERNSAIVKLCAINRILTLVPKEKDIDKLSKLLKELKGVENEIPPKDKDSPWAIQINQAIQNITKNKTIIQQGNGITKSPDRDKGD